MVPRTNKSTVSLTHSLNFYLGHLGNQERSLKYQIGVRSFIQRITENGHRYASGPVQIQTIGYINALPTQKIAQKCPIQIQNIEPLNMFVMQILKISLVV